jgi:hypothetical protein
MKRRGGTKTFTVGENGANLKDHQTKILRFQPVS